MAVIFQKEPDRTFVSMFHQTANNELSRLDNRESVRIHIPEKFADMVWQWIRRQSVLAAPIR